MSPIPNNIPDCTIFLLAKAYQRAHSEFKSLLRPFELTNLQHLVLEGLWYNQGVTATDLSKLLILDKATLSGILDRMIESGWVQKKRDPKDKRIFRLFTTSKADSVKEKLINLRIQANEKLLSKFTQEECTVLKRLLRDLV